MLLIIFNGIVYGKQLPNGILGLPNAQDTNAADGTNIQISQTFQPPKNIKGIYITAESMGVGYYKKLVDALVKSGGNAVVIDIQHGGGLLAFKPKTEFLKQINPGTSTLNNMPAIIDELHKKGIYVIARQSVFNNPYVSSRKPEWRIKKRFGGTFDSQWLDPSKAGVQIYNVYLMQEVAQMGFDEIQFDYIRFPATNHKLLDYYYDENKFTRSDVIDEFLKKARKAADYYGVKISADVFGAIIWGNVDWKTVGQNAAEMAKYLDILCPMTYPSHVSPGYYGFVNPWGDPYSFVQGSIEKFVKAVNGAAEIRTWIQGFPLKAPHFGSWYMEAQIKASFDAGATGYTIWSPGNHYTYSWPTLGLNPEIKTEKAVQ